jgi:biopolymer transport protein ExbD
MQKSIQRVLSNEPNVVPMLDVMLVLLTIFMLTLRVRHTVDVQLPQPQAGGAAPPAIVLSVAPGPVYTLNGQSIPATDLPATLARVYAGRPEKVIFVDGAPTVRYQDVIAAFDVARGAGVRVTAIKPHTP